ncbi:MAG: TlpA family protein disulfide reductase [Sphingobacteriia bacterium]|nr:TlpA family protein disulfide reductase [Sphingobacteriia bacterium]
MKKIIGCYCLMLLCLVVGAQKVIVKITKTSIVKDSSGLNYPYAIWQKLFQTGNYGIKAIDPANVNTEFIIYKYNEAQKRIADSLKSIRAEHAPKPVESKFFKTGDKLTQFSERDINGKKISIKELQGKVVVLNFWFVNCPPCRNEIPELNKLVDKYQDSNNVVFIAVSLDNIAYIKEFLKTQPFKYRIIDDGGFVAQKTYGINLYPTHVVVDTKGIIRFHTSGLTSGTIKWIDKTIESCLADAANPSL